jgi:hypothetical protein
VDEGRSDGVPIFRYSAAAAGFRMVKTLWVDIRDPDDADISLPCVTRLY